MKDGHMDDSLPHVISYAGREIFFLQNGLGSHAQKVFDLR